MIDLKKFNYFSGEDSAVSKAVCKICQMHELCGRNVMLFYNDHSSTFALQYQMQPAHEFKTVENVTSMLDDKSLLFRVDLVVIYAYGLSAEMVDRIARHIKDFEIDFIFAAESYRVVTNSADVAEYTVHSNLIQGKTKTIAGMSMPLKEIRIKSKTDGWSATVEELKASFVRDRRLDDLLGD